MTEDRTALGAARIALASLWWASIITHDVFAEPRFRVGDMTASVGASAAAHHLVALARIGKASELTSRGWDGDALDVAVAHVDHDPDRSTGIGGVATGVRHILLVAGGRGLRVTAAMYELCDATYAIAGPATSAGGPVDGPWTKDRRLPPAWLADIDLVLLLGRSAGNSAGYPLSMGAGFDTNALEDLIAADEDFLRRAPRNLA